MSLSSSRLTLLLLMTLSLMPTYISADVIWDKCIIPENMYVTKHDSTGDFAVMKASIDELDNQVKKYNMNMRTYPGVWGWVSDWGYDSWEKGKKRFLYNHDSPRVSFFSVIVDPRKKNISLMMTSEHQEKEENSFQWVGDNQIFIDGKTNRFADFHCSGSGLYLRWNGRDMQAANEFFDSANGSLSAKLENYTNEETGQDFYYLRIAELENVYPHTGLYGLGMKFYKSFWRKRTPYPHRHHYRYDRRDPDCTPESPRCMMPMMRPGYDPIDRTRTSHDAAKLEYYHYETSSQNNFAKHLPVGISTIRTQLHSLRTNLRSDTLNFTHRAFQGRSVQDMILEAERAVTSGLEAKSKSYDQDFHYKAAGEQLIELEALIRNNRDIIDRTQDGVKSMTGGVYHSKEVIPMLNKMVAELDNARLASLLTRQAVNESDIRKSRINPKVIPKHKLELILAQNDDGEPVDEDEQSEGTEEAEGSSAPEQGYYADNEEEEDDDTDEGDGEENNETVAHDSDGPAPQVAGEATGCQLTAGGQIATYRPRRGDNRFNFNTGISVRVSSDNQKPMVYLQSTKTPWRRHLYGDRPGVDYIIPESDVWCRGALFGVDHTSSWPNTGVLRITVRGIYDNVRKEVYVGSIWSTWDQSWTLSYLLSAYSAITPVGGVVAGIAGVAGLSSALPVAGVGLLGMTVMAVNTAMTILTPYASREVRWAHGKAIDSLLMDPLMGNHYSHGNLNMNYYSTFGTLESDGNIH